MEVKVIRYNRLNRGNCLGLGDVQIGTTVVLRGVVLYKTGEGKHFISPPRRENKGKWYDTGFSFVYEKGKMTAKSNDLMNSIIEAFVTAHNDSNKGGSRNDDSGEM